MCRRWLSGLVLALAVLIQGAEAREKVFVAASLAEVMEDLAHAYSPGLFHTVPGSSSTLARQIRRQAPASLYISANRDWADYVADGQSPVPLFGNRLVVVSARDVRLDHLHEIAGIVGTGRLAVADPGHVPAGIYARRALAYFSLWDRLLPDLAGFDNVRAVARAVDIGAVPFGIVYASDARALGLNVVYVFPEKSHGRIEYWAVALAATPAVHGFFEFLKSIDGKQIIRRHGFVPLDPDR